MLLLNNVFLAAGLILQIFLLALVVRSRRTSALRLFPALLLLYAARTLLLFALFGHVSQEVYTSLYTSLSLLDLALQAALALELALALSRWHSGLRRVLRIATPFLVAAVLTVGLAALLPAHSPAPADRGAIFLGLVFLQLWLGSMAARLAPWRQAVLTGMAVIGVTGVVSQAGRSIAAAHTNAHTFRAWSYTNAAVYLLVLLSWLVWVVRRGPASASHTLCSPTPSPVPAHQASSSSRSTAARSGSGARS